MPGKSKLTADAAERAALRNLSKSEHRDEADRARAILLTLEGQRAEEIAAALGVHVSTVHNWRGYFAHSGVAGLRRRHPPGRQATIGPHRIQAPGQSKKRAMLGAFDPVSRRLLVHISPTKRSTDCVDLL